MKAAQFFAAKDIRVVDVPNPEPKDHEALVAIEWCGICGSDLHEYLHGPMSTPPKERPHPATKDHIPVTMGHEFAGVIISAPDDSNLQPGQAVIVDPRIYCSHCSRCSTGNTQGCTTLGFKGLSGTGGGFSETIAVDARLCYPLPSSVDLNSAPLIEPLTVAWHAISLCDVPDWSTKSTLVLGGGPIGIACMISLRARGCKQIYVSEPTTTRAAQNKQVADRVFNPVSENVEEECLKLTGGVGVDTVFDCAGVQRGMEVGIAALKHRGTYMNVAGWMAPMVVPFPPFLLKEIVVKSSMAYNDDDFKQTVDAFVAGKFKGIETMVTSRIYIDDIVTKGFKELITHKDDHIKILVTPKRPTVQMA